MQAASFWSNVAVAASGCWEWQGFRSPKGYGRVNAPRGRKVFAHRVAWLLSRFVLPEGMLVLHRCDNPPCVNPDHLFMGTHADNSRDMVAKGRRFNPMRSAESRRKAARFGDDHWARRHPELVVRGERRSDFTESDIRAIRDDYAAGGLSTRKLGAKYGISGAHAYSIVSRRAWRHVA